jgi:hypothetical protein
MEWGRPEKRQSPLYSQIELTFFGFFNHLKKSLLYGHSMKLIQPNMGCCELKNSFQLQVKAIFRKNFCSILLGVQNDRHFLALKFPKFFWFRASN